MTEPLIEDLAIVIPAAGSGDRLGLGPKALLELGGKSLLQRVSAKAQRLAAEVIVAAPPGRINEWSGHCPGCVVLQGSESYLRSMESLVRAASRTWVMNVNISSPFASEDLMRNVVNAARVQGMAGAFLPSDLPVARLQNGKVAQLLSRGDTAVAQGPNCYRRSELLTLMDLTDSRDWQQQSFLQIALRHGYRIAAVAGEKTNIKITTADDWRHAQHLNQEIHEL
jgi:2-C-methyl-D-erythritol 4-phosphate cytidylyltransferase